MKVLLTMLPNKSLLLSEKENKNLQHEFSHTKWLSKN